MASHPINLTVRFLLEIIAWLAPGFWGWNQHTGLPRWALAIGLPVLSATLWGLFRVPNDPGPAPVAVPGLVRLGLEAVVFGIGVWAFYAAGRGGLGLAFGLVILAHYITSYDRLVWLARQ